MYMNLKLLHVHSLFTQLFVMTLFTTSTWDISAFLCTKDRPTQVSSTSDTGTYSCREKHDS